MYEVITFGSGSIDIFAETRGEHVVQLHTEEHSEDLIAYPSGEKLIIKELHTEIGGGGTNVAACLKKLGISVAYAGCLGADEAGDNIRAWLEKEGIGFLGTRSDEKTNLSVILDSKQLHDRTILVYKGASDMLDIKDLDLSKLTATWFYFSSLLGTSFKTMIQLMRHARQNNIAVAFNPSSYQTQQGLSAIREALCLSQLFVLNKEEAEMLVGHGSREELCRRLRDSGGEIVMVTDGGKGATLLYADRLYSIRRMSEIKVVETTGAGDCFSASFLAGLIVGLSVESSLRMAFLNAESLIGQVGAKNGLLTREELLKCLNKDDHIIEHQNL